MLKTEFLTKLFEIMGISIDVNNIGDEKIIKTELSSGKYVTFYITQFRTKADDYILITPNSNVKKEKRSNICIKMSDNIAEYLLHILPNALNSEIYKSYPNAVILFERKMTTIDKQYLNNIKVSFYMTFYIDGKLVSEILYECVKKNFRNEYKFIVEKRILFPKVNHDCNNVIKKEIPIKDKSNNYNNNSNDHYHSNHQKSKSNIVINDKSNNNSDNVDHSNHQKSTRNIVINDKSNNNMNQHNNINNNSVCNFNSVCSNGNIFMNDIMSMLEQKEIIISSDQEREYQETCNRVLDFLRNNDIAIKDFHTFNNQYIIKYEKIITADIKIEKQVIIGHNLIFVLSDLNFTPIYLQRLKLENNFKIISSTNEITSLQINKNTLHIHCNAQNRFFVYKTFKDYITFVNYYFKNIGMVGLGFSLQEEADVVKELIEIL